MYDIRNLNIWKESCRDNIFLCQKKVLTADGSRKEVTILTDKCMEVMEKIETIAPGVNFFAIKKRRGGKLRFPMYINKELKETELEILDLSVRSSNCLHRAGYHTIGELVEDIEFSEDLKKIRNCGAKSIDEIMEKLFCYQYTMLDDSKKIKYIQQVLELNR